MIQADKKRSPQCIKTIYIASKTDTIFRPDRSGGQVRQTENPSGFSVAEKRFGTFRSAMDVAGLPIADLISVRLSVALVALILTGGCWGGGGSVFNTSSFNGIQALSVEPVAPPSQTETEETPGTTSQGSDSDPVTAQDPSSTTPGTPAPGQEADNTPQGSDKKDDAVTADAGSKDNAPDKSVQNTPSDDSAPKEAAGEDKSDTPADVVPVNGEDAASEDNEQENDPDAAKPGATDMTGDDMSADKKDDADTADDGTGDNAPDKSGQNPPSDESAPEEAAGEEGVDSNDGNLQEEETDKGTPAGEMPVDDGGSDNTPMTGMDTGDNGGQGTPTDDNSGEDTSDTPEDGNPIEQENDLDTAKPGATDMTGDDMSAEQPRSALGLFATLPRHADVREPALAEARTVASANRPSGLSGGHAVSQASTGTGAVEAGVGEGTYSLSLGSSVFLDSGAALVPATVISTPYEASSLEEIVILHDDDDKSAIIAHDKEGSADNEYIAWGLWSNIPPADTGSSYLYGVFAYGAGDYTYPQARIRELEGLAHYHGQAVGVDLTPGVTEGATGRTNAFVADADLTVDFRDSLFTGRIRGEIGNFRYQNGDNNRIQRVILKETWLGDTDGGLFSGGPSGAVARSSDGETISGLTGRWGGKLYGSSHAPGEEHIVPAHVAGTFGLSHDTDMVMLGAFKTDYQAPHPLTVFNPAASSPALTAIRTHTEASSANFFLGRVAEAGNFGNERWGNCSTVSCNVYVGNTSITFEKFSASNLSLINTTRYSLTELSSLISDSVSIDGISYVRGKTTGSNYNDTVRYEFESFGGWTDGSVFAAVHFAQATASGEIHRFVPYTLGVVSGSHPTSGTAIWRGGAIASVKDDRTFIRGNATVTVDFTDTDVDVLLDGWHGTDGAPMPSIGAVSYMDMDIVSQGRFYGTLPEQFAGRFYGSDHGEVGGVFNTPALNGAFGAVRDSE